MRPHQFYAKLANTPLKNRFTILNFAKHGDLNLNKLYEEVKDLEDKMRPYQIQLDYLMKIADEYYFKDNPEF